jgi:methylthioribose-1-phosphate isomerase
MHPAFDVTPSELVTAIVTERGVARQPLGRTLPRLVAGPEQQPARPAARERKTEPRKQRRR